MRPEKDGVRFILGVLEPSYESRETSEPARLIGLEPGLDPGLDPGPRDGGLLPPRLPGVLLSPFVVMYLDCTGADPFRPSLCSLKPEPPSSLKDESGVPALKDARPGPPIPTLFPVRSRTLMIGPALGRDCERVC